MKKLGDLFCKTHNGKMFSTRILISRLLLFILYASITAYIIFIFLFTPVSIAKSFASREEEPCLTYLGILPGHDRSLYLCLLN